MTRADRDRPAALRASAAQQAQIKLDNGGKTGAPPGMLQDDSRGLSKYLANSPHARQHVKEACAALAKEQGDTP